MKRSLLTDNELHMLTVLYNNSMKNNATNTPSPGCLIKEISTESDVTESSSSLTQIRSLTDLCQETGFIYDPDNKVLCCDTCTKGKEFRSNVQNQPGFFQYDSEEFGSNFNLSEKNIPAEFTRLKRSVSRHLDTKIHTQNVKDTSSIKFEEDKCNIRAKEVGMRLGRSAYMCYKKGLPERFFEELRLLHVLNKTDIGDLNHSKRFYMDFRKCVASVVTEQLTLYLTTPLVQTGFRPIINVAADKATWKHRTRQFTVGSIIPPESSDLITTVHLGLPVVKGHNGIDIAKSIKEVLDERKIIGKQVGGISADGQYVKLNVEAGLKTLYGPENSKNMNISWDPMHKAGNIDKHITDNDIHSWVDARVTLCQDLYNALNWGQSFEEYTDTGESLGHKVTPLVKTSETRFANSKRFVFSKVIDNFPSIVKHLEDKFSRNKDGDSKARDKANKASVLLGRLLNAQSVLEIACLSDIYNHYGKVINCCQILNILPHERLSLIDSAISDFSDLTNTYANHSQCSKLRVRSDINVSKSGPCYWPKLHKAKES